MPSGNGYAWGHQLHAHGHHVQGNCTEVPAKNVDPALPRFILAGSCVLFIALDGFHFHSSVYNSGVTWLSSILLRIDEPATSTGSSPIYWDMAEGDTSKLYLSRMTVQSGGNPRSRALFARGGSVYGSGAPRPRMPTHPQHVYSTGSYRSVG